MTAFHIKVLVAEDGTLTYTAAGKGILDYPRYLSLLRAHGFSGPLMLHGLTEDEVEASVRFVRGILDGQRLA